MLIIQMLMKRATAGALPLLQAGAKLREEILAGPSFDEAPSSAWVEEERILAGVKKTFLLVAGAALERHRDRPAEQQEIRPGPSGIVMECHAIRSFLRRVQKSGTPRGGETSAGR